MPTEPIVFEPWDSFGATASAVLVIVFGAMVTAPLVFAVWRAIVFRGRVLRAEASEKAPHPAEAGTALLPGRVETEDGRPAVRIEIEQTGQEQSNKGHWTHTWTETKRAVHVRPFRLRLEDGTAVEVAPDERVRLVDMLVTDKYERRLRRRVAELENGEDVWVSGVLAAEGARDGTKTTAYRTGPGGLVLRGTRMEPLEIASGDLGAQFSIWKSFYYRAAAWMAAAFLLVHGALFGHFYAELFAGKVETATFQTTRTYTTTHKGRTTTHYVLVAQLPDAYGNRAVTGEVRSGIYDMANRGKIKEVPYVVVPAMPEIYSIGTFPDLYIGWGLLAGVVAITAAVGFLVARSRAMPWYEQGRVVESGSGRLSESADYVQIPGKPGVSPLRNRPRKKRQS